MKLKYLLFGGIAMLLGACADDSVTNGNDNNDNPNQTPSSLNTASYSLNKANTSRVSNYYASGKTRAGEFEMPAYDAARAANAQEITSDGWFNGSGDYKISGNKNIQMNASGEINLFITADYSGKIEMNNASPLNVYVAPGATYYFGDQNKVINQTYNLFVYGNLDAKNLELSSNQSIYVLGDLDIPGTITSNGNNTRIYAGGGITVNKLTPATDFTMSGCYVKISESFESWSQDFWIEAKYFEIPTISLGGDRSGIRLADGGMVKADKLTFQGNNSSNKITGDGNIVIKEIVINNFDNNANDFAGHFEGYVYNETATPAFINNHQVARESQKGAFRSYEEGLALEEPVCDESEEPEGPSLEMVARVLNHDHNSDKPSLRRLSATSITYGNGKYYASYHMRGLNYDNDHYDKEETEEYANTEGCIEAWTMNGDVLTLGNWMWIDSIDFNHIYFDVNATSGQQLLTVGNHAKKGGIFGYVSENFDDEANIGDNNSLNYSLIKSGERIESASGALQDYANGGDVNSVVRDNGNYLITTSRGYGAVDANTKTQLRNEDNVPELNIINDSVSVKHITKYGNGYAVLALDERQPATSDQVSSPATIYYFNSEADVINGNYSSSTSLSKEIRPIDGKNVLFAYGNELYACLGHGGLYRVSDGKTWQRAENEKDDTSTGNVPVNGVFVDENFIYVANGSFLSVLNKDMEEIAYYRVPEVEDRVFSANYVYVRDGLIFVAFGQDGIRVLRLKNV